MSSKKPRLEEIENGFQPAKEVSDADRFAGRVKAVSDAFLGLLTVGANLAIVGNRGIGKTSLARQIENFGRGDNSLLNRIGLHFDHKFDYQVMYLACGNGISNREDLLARLITSEKCFQTWIYELPKTKKMMHSLSPKLGAKLLGFTGDISTQHSVEETKEVVSVPHTIDGVFENIVNHMVDENLTRDGILIIIDEFDQIGDPSGVGPFLKALATNTKKVKFCIVGVAKDVQDLMKEHASSDRLFAGSIVPLEPMSGGELKQIIEIAEQSIHSYIKFDDSARNRMVTLAQGHPYLVHLIGKFALRAAYIGSHTVISQNDIETVLSSIAENGSDPVLEGRHRKAVASSAQRETVLRALAIHQDDKGEVWTTDAYKTALEGGVENPSQYVGQLVTDQYGAELENVRERYYRFKDSLFVAYAKARPPMRGLAKNS